MRATRSAGRAELILSEDPVQEEILEEPQKRFYNREKDEQKKAQKKQKRQNMEKENREKERQLRQRL